MQSRTPLLLFPCNGNAIEAIDCLGEQWVCVGFVDDTPAKQGTMVRGVQVLGREALTRWPEARVLAVPGGPATYRNRRDVIDSLALAPTRFANVAHPRASISPDACIGHNSLIMAGVVLTSNARLGNHCCVLPNTVVHHDSTLGDECLVGANVTIAGGVSIGRACYIGSASSVMHGLSIGEGALVGFGANVIRDVDAGTRVVGNPARALPSAATTEH